MPVPDLVLLAPRSTGDFAADARFAPLEAGMPPAVPEVVPAAVAEALPDPVAHAHATGFAEGLAAGRAAALVEAEAVQASQTRLKASYSRLDAQLADTLRQRLTTAVVALCETALAPLALDLPALVARINRTVAMFARADDERVIRLHPEDLALARPLLPADWVLQPEPTMARGALRVETRCGGAEDGPEQWHLAITRALDLC